MEEGEIMTEKEFGVVPEVKERQALEKQYRIKNVAIEINTRLNDLRLLYAELADLEK